MEPAPLLRFSLLIRGENRTGPGIDVDFGDLTVRLNHLSCPDHPFVVLLKLCEDDFPGRLVLGRLDCLFDRDLCRDCSFRCLYPFGLLAPSRHTPGRLAENEEPSKRDASRGANGFHGKAPQEVGGTVAHLSRESMTQPLGGWNGAPLSSGHVPFRPFGIVLSSSHGIA